MPKNRQVYITRFRGSKYIAAYNNTVIALSLKPNIFPFKRCYPVISLLKCPILEHAKQAQIKNVFSCDNRSGIEFIVYSY